eukprot:5447799-Pyramimonas_sp.AAC.1
MQLLSPTSNVRPIERFSSARGSGVKSQVAKSPLSPGGLEGVRSQESGRSVAPFPGNPEGVWRGSGVKSQVTQSPLSPEIQRGSRGGPESRVRSLSRLFPRQSGRLLGTLLGRGPDPHPKQSQEGLIR